MCRYLQISFMVQIIVSTVIGFTACMYASTEQNIGIDVTGEQLEVMLIECE